MVDAKRQDSSRDLLEELEDGWGTPPAPSVIAADAARPMPEIPDDAELDNIDGGWLDELFPEAEEPDEPEEPEPELPDERVDPVAFAAAKKAREERAAARKEKKRLKLEAKRARQKARAAAVRQKQKAQKQRGKPQKQKARKPEKKKARVAAPAAARATDDIAPIDELDDGDESAEAMEKVVRPSASGGKVPPSTLGSIKLLAIVLAVLIAVAVFAAAVIK